ncbi:MAG: PucR family transcriptional regulator [Lachnospiraceae bacterium]
MSVTLRKLIGKVAHLDVVLIAGKNGLDRPVTWIHMVENFDASTFLEGDDLVITTGISLHAKSDLLPLVQAMEQHGAAGVILNTGPYLDQAPQEVLDFCNAKDLPFFTVPWEIRISDILRIICYELTKDDQRAFQQSAAFKNAIFFPEQTQLYLVPLSEYGYATESPFTVAVAKIRGPERPEVIAENLDRVILRLTYSLNHKFQGFSIFSYNDELLAVLADYDPDALRSFISLFSSMLPKLLDPGESFVLGVGKTTRSARCLYKSYRQAVCVCRLQETAGSRVKSVYYADMGLYKLLMNIEDQDVLQDYYDHTIAPLADYDAKHGTNLVPVLDSYLTHNCSLRDTAEELFIHRNTVTYRLNKIHELTHLDLTSERARLELSMGLLLKKML